MGLDKKPVTDFSNDKFADLIKKVKGEKVPVGGFPMPEKMPRFDQPPPARTDGVQAPRPQAPKGAVLSQAEQEELAARGGLRQGVGSGLRVNQPAAGVQPVAIEQPTAAEPQGVVMRPEGSGLREETLSQLAAVADANKAKAAAKPDDVDADLAKTAEEIAEIEGEFETDEWGNQIRNIFNNKKRRDLIEARCEPMKLEDLLLNGEVRQRVPVFPGKIEPTYRSVSSAEDLFIKRKMSGTRGSETYTFDMYSVMNLTASLYALSGRMLPSHISPETGEADEKLFDAKFKLISKMPLVLLADLSVNYVWFARRVEKLLVFDDIKGF